MARSSRFVRWVAGAVAFGAVLGVSGGASADTGDVRVIVSFDEAKGENPEGIAVDRDGNLFVSVSPLGDIWRTPSGSAEPEPFGHVDGIVPGRDFGVLGLAVDTGGDVYAGVQSVDPAVNGVWRFDDVTGEESRLSGSAAIGIPNGLTFDRRSNLFVTDSAGGAIWRIRSGGAAEVWLENWRLRGNGSLGLFLGANGIAFRRGVFTVTNTERRTVLRIEKDSGDPGAIHVVTRLPVGDNPDGVQLDVHGGAYVALNIANEIVKVTPDGHVRVLASGDPLDFPSSVAFGTTFGERRSLFGVSFSISENFGLPPGVGPSVWRLRTDEVGVLMP